MMCVAFKLQLFNIFDTKALYSPLKKYAISRKTFFYEQSKQHLE